MTNFFVLVLLVIALGLGVVIGETYAPISGSTVQKLDSRLSTLEGQVQTIDLRCTRLESKLDEQR